LDGLDFVDNIAKFIVETVSFYFQNGHDKVKILPLVVFTKLAQRLQSPMILIIQLLQVWVKLHEYRKYSDKLSKLFCRYICMPT